ncbi:MAG: hypothetical protein PHU60_07545 [Tissierellia bacterium]|nr:hypothetical protein [Tissierellia bacterium]
MSRIAFAHAEIKELNSYYNIKDGEKLIDNKKLNTVEILKKIYESIDSHSSFYSKDELKIDVFHKKDLDNQTSVDYEINEDICYISIYNFNDNVQ